jgi:tripartite-type tricarboxylate transporter receptor subunit TctC
MIKAKRLTGAGLVLSLVVLLIATAEGAPAWKPTQTLKCIDLGGSPGNAYDLIARQISNVLPDYLGVRINVQNISGGMGLTGLDMLSRSEPDGHTFAISPMPAYVALAISKPLKVDASEFKIPLAILVPPYALMASKKSPYTSVSQVLNSKERIRLSVAQSNFACIGLAAFFNEKGLQYVVARHKGPSEAEMAVRSGDADLYIAAATSVGLRPFTDGDAQAIMVFDDKRVPQYPNVPCLTDVGMPEDLKFLRPLRLFIFPPGVPQERINVVRDGLMKALQDPRILEWSKKADIPVDLADSASLDKRVKAVLDYMNRYPELVQKYFF